MSELVRFFPQSLINQHRMTPKPQSRETQRESSSPPGKESLSKGGNTGFGRHFLSFYVSFPASNLVNELL